MFEVKYVGINSSVCICNGRCGRLLSEQPGRDSKQNGAAMSDALDSRSLSPVILLGDEIPCKAFNYGVNCHQITLRLHSVLISTITATSDGLFALLEGCLCLLGAIIIVLHSFLSQYFESSIVYIFRFTEEIPLWHS